MNMKNLTYITDDSTPEKQKKSTAIYVKVSPEEKAKIERNMAIIGSTNLSAFARRMLLSGAILKVDVPEIQEISRLMSFTANNVNQLTKRVNGGGHAYREDVAHLESQFAECRALLGKVISKLSKI